MRKRSIVLSLASAALASMAFAAPGQAAPTLVTTQVAFSVSDGGTATDVEITYTPGVDPVSSPTLITSGGLTGIVASEPAPNTAMIKFNPANATFGFLTFSFITATLPPIDFSAASLTGVSTGASGTLSVGVTAAAIPEPTSVALLGIGIGMIGFLPFRRFFKRSRPVN
jgi:hypothetical protein